MLNELNAWITQNQALVISIGLPCFTVMVGFMGSYLVHKSKLDEVKLAGRMKLADLRKENFDELKEEVARLQSLLTSLAMGKIFNKEDKLLFSKDDMSEVIQAAEKIMVRVRVNSEQIEEFEKLFPLVLKDVIGEGESKGGLFAKLRKLCLNILADEWRQIESELKDLG
jgi:hypothetical protein